MTVLEAEARTTCQHVENAVAGLSRDGSSETAQSNLALIASLGRSESVSTLLSALLADSERLAEVAARSYRHTNHFDKIVLVDSGDPAGYRLTLHSWRPPYSDVDAADEQIHDHRFNFWSTILVGTLRSQNYERSGVGVSIGEYQYVPEKRAVATVGNYYRFVGSARLAEVAPSVQPRGSSYHLRFHRIHRVVLPRENLTCTLVLRGPRQRDYASVFSNSQRYEPSANVMFTTAELARRLRVIADAVCEPL